MAVMWHSLRIDEAFKKLRVTEKGLTSDEASSRLKEYGFNEIEEAGKRSLATMFLDQFKSFLILILIIAALISLVLGDLADAGVISFVLLMNALLGFYQEYKAEQAVEALKRLVAPHAKVIRNGEKVEIPAREIVPGDLVLLEMGDRVPADLRLIETLNLQIDEATLTGESTPVLKNADAVLDAKTPLNDRVNMAYMGTVVVKGRGMGITVATGMKTELGKVATLVQTVEEEETPLQKRLGELGRKLGLIVIMACGIIFLAGFLRGTEVLELFLASVSLAVAVVPESLPAIVTITLALGVQRMAKKNAIVRKLPAVETLGCATIICSDKTGTITKNEMVVREVFIPDKRIPLKKGEVEKTSDTELQHLSFLFKIATLCNDAEVKSEDGNMLIIGDPTEGALLLAALDLGIDVRRLREENPRIYEFPFEPERKRMETINKWMDERAIVCVKGAPEVILESSSYFMENGEIKRMSDERRNKILEENHVMAEKALRVLAVAYKEVEMRSKYSMEEVEDDLIFLGLIGIMDPPREEAKHSVEKCRDAGIKVVMITGDNVWTAEAIAREVGIFEEGKQVLTGVELEEMDVSELEEVVDDVAVYARVSPEHKLKIVSALKNKGHVVAMTGDGANDAPALKKADIGVAMGITGTDVSKEAADMVLSDDNFATIVTAVEEGRTIYENIRKSVFYLLATNAGELLTIFVAMVLGFPLPLTAAQILWINLVTDSFPALALSVEPPEADIMKRPPRNPKTPMITKGSAMELAGCGILMACVTLLVYSTRLWNEFGFNYEEARALAFVTLIMFQLFNAINYRSEKISIFKLNPFSNKYLVLALMVSFVLQLLVIYVPSLQPLFKTFPLSVRDWVTVLLAASTIILLYELKKAYQRKISKETAAKERLVKHFSLKSNHSTPLNF
ncbi:MAG: calcium-transporting P-type ATPase, PMR1-type [Candidatus Freyarchaeota archaeon]|nr:calcium-transporting P-type ATPase, PMR1-type [Candidatus Freyrarchaeum guaymaensis]